MTNYQTTQAIQDFPLWARLAEKRSLVSFELELTARCPNDCRHCYINLPADDREARANELSLEEITRLGREAVELGALWCLLTGGDPLVRPDFSDIYLALKRAGLLLSVFTTAQLVTDDHVALFQRYRPRDIEITVYGASAETYERVTRKAGSYAAFRRGLEQLEAAGIPIRLKAVLMRANVHDFPAIADFCREHSQDYFRFDAALHLRYDGNAARNAEIVAERLTPEEVRLLEDADPERAGAVETECRTNPTGDHFDYAKCQACVRAEMCEELAERSTLLRCAAGKSSATIGYDGTFRLCGSLHAPGTTADLRQVSLREAWEELTPLVRALRATRLDRLAACGNCALVILCLWCPAHAYLETGDMEGETPYFCEVAHARAR